MISRARLLGNRVLPLKVKYVCIVLLTSMLIVVAFWLQNTAIARAQYCDRVGTRADLRSVLLYAVDLGDVLPGDAGAMLYTANRTNFINNKYPALDPKDCQ